METHYPGKNFLACSARQINLVVKDALKCVPDFVQPKKVKKIATSPSKGPTLLGTLCGE